MERNSAARLAAVATVTAAFLTACSVTVQPKNAAAVHPLSSGTSSSSAASSTPTPTPTPDKPTSTPSVGKDVDHTVCTAVREALLTAQQKVAADKESPRHMGTDYRTAAGALRTQAAKTKNSELKTTLEALASAYQGLGNDTIAHASTENDQKKVTEASKPLDTLCGAKS
ncbi:MAG: hypothetical protein JF587_25660 [Catenulisporales bacterium]|nr:hypothetical protein [Catenulisporales bacterium]